MAAGGWVVAIRTTQGEWLYLSGDPQGFAPIAP